MPSSIWDRKTFCIITGASRGIGRTIAIQFAQKVLPDSTFLLIARSADGLTDTKNEMFNIAPKVNVVTIPMDLSSSQLEDHYTSALSDCLHLTNQVPNDFNQAMVIHNAGTLGETEYISDLPHLKDSNLLTDYFRLNLFSAMALNDQFLKMFSSAVSFRSVINITSLAAIKPMKAAMLYCTGKAAREMFFRCLATEQPDLSVLNYSPGPVDTDMLSYITKNTADPETKSNFEKYYKDGIVLSCEATVLKLMSVLEEQKYKSGDHVDYFDRNTQVD